MENNSVLTDTYMYLCQEEQSTYFSSSAGSDSYMTWCCDQRDVSVHDPSMSSTLASLMLLFCQKKCHQKWGWSVFLQPNVHLWQHLMLFLCRSTQIKTYSWDNAQVVLAGNKCDMEEERVVSVDNGRLLAEQLGEAFCCRRAFSHPWVADTPGSGLATPPRLTPLLFLGFEFFETSAKDNVNVKQTFERLVDLICDKMSESLDSEPAVPTGAPTAKLTDSAPPLQQPGCNC